MAAMEREHANKGGACINSRERERERELCLTWVRLSLVWEEQALLRTNQSTF